MQERKFLEAARRTIQQAVTNAGAKLDSEHMLNYAANAGLQIEGGRDTEPSQLSKEKPSSKDESKKWWLHLKL